MTRQDFLDQLDRARRNKRETRRLLNWMRACRSARRRFAGMTFNDAWEKANSRELYWFLHYAITTIAEADRGDSCHRLPWLHSIALRVAPRDGRKAADIIRAGFRPDGRPR